MSEMSVREAIDESGSMQDVDAQFERYVAQQPGWIRAIHRGLDFLKAASLGFVAGIFVKALIVSIQWKEVNPLEIPFWWILFAASGLPLALCLGLDAMVLRAVPGKMNFLGVGRDSKSGSPRLVTGAWAVLSGSLIILAGLVWAAINGAFAYFVLTLDMGVLDIATRALGILIGAFVAVQVISHLLRDFSKMLR